MSFVAAAIVGLAVVQNVQAIDARQDAKEQFKKDQAAALEAQQFADTEGEGVGSMGNINLSIDSSIDDDVRSQGKANVSI
tara:strand:- start:2116 stop:2355 length:240 start_codon:yes stop_codon:yes gene_type:complete